MSDENKITDEKFRAVPGYKGLFISLKGTLISITGNRCVVMKWANKAGYYSTSYRGKSTILQHRLIMITYNPIRGYKKFDIDHKNCDPLDNRIENLRWCTAKENKRYSVDLGRHAVGEKHGMSKLNWDKVRVIRKSYKIHSSKFGAKALAKKFGVSKNTIIGVIAGKTWRDYG